jgi:hypothetical protein
MSRVKDQYFDEINENSFESIAAKRADDELATQFDNYRPLDNRLKKLEKAGERSRDWAARHKIKVSMA